jgi:peptidoglycan hydrolase CwlO-like protein
MAPREPVLRHEFARLEERVTVLEESVQSESGLRAMMDHDQASLTTRLEAQDRLLRALATTQSDHTARLTRVEAGQERLEAGQQRLEERTGRIEEHGLELERIVGHVREGIDTILVLLRDTQ